MSRFSSATVGLGLLMAVSLTACGPPTAPAFPAPDSVPAVDPAQVESVLFFLGDAGDALLGTSPTLARLQQDIEQWSAALPDSSVALLVLGDIRYPEGVHDQTSPQFAADSAVVLSQVRTVAGPMALERGTKGYFLPGNHDWGGPDMRDGYGPLFNLDALLKYANTSLGSNVQLVPDAGTGGPHVVDWGEHFRLLLLDTAWWILDATDDTRDDQLAGIETAMERAGNRSVLIAGHHPFKSAGSHGGNFSFWRSFGVRYILNRSGAVLEDVTSVPYRRLERGLRGIFERQEPPLVYVGGHDHSLQVIAATESTDPTFNVVAGSGSKLSEIGTREGLVFGQEAPGYVRLVIERDGDATLFVEAVSSDYLVCPASEPARAACMVEGMADFHTAYWRNVR